MNSRSTSNGQRPQHGAHPSRWTARRVAAGILSATVPGLGQWLNGERRLAAVFLAPAVIGAIAFVVFILVSGIASAAAYLIDPPRPP